MGGGSLDLLQMEGGHGTPEMQEGSSFQEAGGKMVQLKTFAVSQ